jgi:hypothetical protein
MLQGDEDMEETTTEKTVMHEVTPPVGRFIVLRGDINIISF